MRGRVMDALPFELKQVFEQNSAAQSIFEALPPSHKREYCVWIEQGKKMATRQARAEKAVAMMIERHTSKG